MGDPRRAGESAGKLFGFATYLAPHASKADIYTDIGNRTRRFSPRQIIITRALLGRSYRTLAPMSKAMRPPDHRGGWVYDSVWADSRFNGGCVDSVEVMLYEKSQACPIAVVSYIHVDSCACAECQH